MKMLAQIDGSYLRDRSSNVGTFPAERDGCSIIVIINDSVPE